MGILEGVVSMVVNWFGVSLCLFAVVVILSVRYFKIHYSIFTQLNIPGPKPAMLFGNSLAFKSKFILDVFSDWYKQYGKVFGYYEGLQPSLVISQPEIIKQILGKQFDKFHDRTKCVPFLYWPDNINMVNARGCQWKRERDVTASAFNSTSLREMVPEISLVADKLIDILATRASERTPFNIADLCDRFAVDSFALAAFGFPVNSLENDDDLLLKFMRANFQQGDVENPITGLARLFPRLVPVLKLFNGEYEKIHNQHLENVRDLIKRSQEDFMNQNVAKKNLMTNLLQGCRIYQDDQNNDCKRGLTDDELLSQVHGLIGAGFGQTNNLLSFAIYNMARYPDVQMKVCQEIDDLGLLNESLSFDALGQMEYLDRVLYETLRVFPIAPGVTRLCNTSCEIEGVEIQEGMAIRLMSSPMYSDPEIYPEPDKFDPNRFTAEEKAKRHPQTFLGIGYGPRMCIGWRLGMIQCKAAIVRLLQHYSVHLHDEVPLETTLRPVLCPKNGVWVHLEER